MGYVVVLGAKHNYIVNIKHLIQLAKPLKIQQSASQPCRCGQLPLQQSENVPDPSDSVMLAENGLQCLEHYQLHLTCHYA